MKKIAVLLLFLITQIAVIPVSAATKKESRADKIVREIHNPKSKYVVVICHRGDWRNYPENSIQSIESIIKMGADMMELDLKLTKDSVLVLCHDATVDRTTTGKGKVSDLTYAEISKLSLRRGHGVADSRYRMPTLREALKVCKDRIVVNVDQGYQFYDLVLKITEELGMTDQVLIKGKKPAREVAEKMASHPHNMMYMPIVNLPGENGEALIKEYKERGEVPLAYEVCWNEMSSVVSGYMQQIINSGSKLWVNALWPSLNGGLDDDAAFDGNPDNVYGKLLGFGASMIQTDRPEYLIKYLQKKGRHTLK